MPTHLSQFLRQQLTLQQLTEKQFAQRAGLGLSHVYQILRGERKHTRGDTLDKIGLGLGMTPAEMASLMGRGGSQADLDPELTALLRQLPDEHRPTLKTMLRGLVSHAREHHVTVDRDDFDRPNCQPGLQGRSIRKSDIVRRESRSVASMVTRFGLQPV